MEHLSEEVVSFETVDLNEKGHFYRNQSAYIGGAIGSMFTPIVGTAIGAAIGHGYDKRRMEKEAEEARLKEKMRVKKK